MVVPRPGASPHKTDPKAGREGVAAGGGAPTLEAQQRYIARLEAALAAGGLPERCARLEGRIQRLQQRARRHHTLQLEQAAGLEARAVEVAALRRALERQVEEWGLRTEEGVTPASVAQFLGRLAVAEQRAEGLARDLERARGDLEAALRRGADLAAEAEAAAAQASERAAAAEEQVATAEALGAELRAMEETKAQLLDHLDRVVQELSETKETLEAQRQIQAEQETAHRAAAERMAAALAEGEGAVEEARSRERQLLMVRTIQSRKLAAEGLRVTEMQEALAAAQHRLEQLAEATTAADRHVLTLEGLLDRATHDCDAAVEERDALRGDRDVLTTEVERLRSDVLRAVRQHQATAGELAAAVGAAEGLEAVAFALRGAGALALPDDAAPRDPVASVHALVHRASQLQGAHDALALQSGERVAKLEAALEAERTAREAAEASLWGKEREAQRLQLLLDAARRRCLIGPALDAEFGGAGGADWPIAFPALQPAVPHPRMPPAAPTPPSAPAPPLHTPPPSGRVPTLADLASPDADLLLPLA